MYDESSRQHLKETHQPLPMKPGKPLRYDAEYERNGTGNLFLLFAPLRGRRRIDVTASRTATDRALQIRQLVDEDYPGAKKIR